MSPKDEFIHLLHQQLLVQGDVIFVMQGDGVHRAAHAVDLWKRGFAPLVAIVGSADDRAYGSFPSREVRAEMIRLGLPEDALLFEDTRGAHTRAEADRALELAKERGWKTILVLTSPHHQYRAFLTFVQAMQDGGVKLKIINAVAPLSMTEQNPWGARDTLQARNFDKLEEYQQKGDVASYEDGIRYLQTQV